MPMRRDAYPADWEKISRKVREKAGWRCEACGVKNAAWIARQRDDRRIYRYCEPDFAGDQQWRPAVRVVLSVHHIGIPHPDGTPGDPHDKMDVRDDNLVALCQRCHFLADIKLHVSNRRHNRYLRKLGEEESSGQMRLW